MFNSKDFIQIEDGINSKAYEWNNIEIRCTYIIDNKIWYFRFMGINHDATNSLDLEYSIGKVMNKKALISAINKMFNNKYKNAYHKIICGVLNGEMINDTLYLGIIK